MNYLQLLQRTIEESGATLSAPTSVTGLKGLESKFAKWVQESWKEIQLERSDWLFSAKEQELDLDPVLLEQGSLVPPSDFAADYLQEWRSLPVIEVWLEEYVEPVVTHEAFNVSDIEGPGYISYSVYNPDYTPGSGLPEYLEVNVAVS